MKYITYLIKNFISKDIPNLVGRWKIEHCDMKINRKIDLSNVDHCGTCGNFILEKIELEDPRISGFKERSDLGS